MSSTFTCLYEFGDTVRVDNSDIVGVVTAFSFQGHGAKSVEVSWFVAGVSYEKFFPLWRLKGAEQ